MLHHSRSELAIQVPLSCAWHLCLVSYGKIIMVLVLSSVCSTSALSITEDEHPSYACILLLAPQSALEILDEVVTIGSNQCSLLLEGQTI